MCDEIAEVIRCGQEGKAAEPAAVPAEIPTEPAEPEAPAAAEAPAEGGAKRCPACDAADQTGKFCEYCGTAL